MNSYDSFVLKVKKTFTLFNNYRMAPLLSFLLTVGPPFLSIGILAPSKPTSLREGCFRYACPVQRTGR